MLNLYSMNIRCSRLSRLPQELLSEILHHLDDDADLICLALTCRHFLSILEKQVRAALQTDAAPWVGDRIILLRDYAYGLPDSSLSEPEESELSLRKQEGVEDDQEELASPRRPYYHAEDQHDYARRRRIYKSVSTSLDDAERTIVNQLCPDDLPWARLDQTKYGF